ncbi:MAG: hypothetical protein ACOX1I_01145 [Dethiobacteria bacterium]
MTLALSEGDNYQKWDKIYQPTCFFVGKERRSILFGVPGAAARNLWCRCGAGGSGLRR